MIKLLAVGNIKDKALQQLIDEYVKRIAHYQKISIETVNDEKIPNKASDAEIKQIIELEGQKILAKINNEYVILLDLHAQQLDSVAFAQKIQSLQTYGHSDICFVIGGSCGVSDALRQRSDMRLQLSKMTFLHQMTRLIILEQIYRTFKILNNETYHK